MDETACSCLMMDDGSLIANVLPAKCWRGPIPPALAQRPLK